MNGRLHRPTQGSKARAGSPHNTARVGPERLLRRRVGRGTRRPRKICYTFTIRDLDGNLIRRIRTPDHRLDWAAIKLTRRLRPPGHDEPYVIDRDGEEVAELTQEWPGSEWDCTLFHPDPDADRFIVDPRNQTGMASDGHQTGHNQRVFKHE